VRKPFGRAADRRADCRLKRAGARPRRQRRHASAAAEAAPRGESAQGQAGSRAEQPVDRTPEVSLCSRRTPPQAIAQSGTETVKHADTYGNNVEPHRGLRRSRGGGPNVLMGRVFAERAVLHGDVLRANPRTLPRESQASTKRECKVFAAHPCDRTLLMETD
jgi:hypothetical protein